MRLIPHVAALAVALFACAQPAAGQKISALPAAATPAATDKVVVVQGAGCATSAAPCTTAAMTLAQVASYAAASPAAASTYQPLDSDLSSIAALTTTLSGRDLLTAADAAAIRSKAGVTASGADSAYAWRANNLSDVGSVSTARGNLGLGTMATQAASGVAITGGSIAGITDLAIADGGTGASDAATARANLGVASSVDVQVFTANGTWTKPVGAKRVFVRAEAGAGGGGGGPKVAASTAASGGAGGGGGAIVEEMFDAAALPASVAVQVGPGGAGGPGATAIGPGQNGSSGSPSYFGTQFFVYARTGTGGGYGSAGAPSGGGAGANGSYLNGGNANGPSAGTNSTGLGNGASAGAGTAPNGITATGGGSGASNGAAGIGGSGTWFGGGGGGGGGGFDGTNNAFKAGAFSYSIVRTGAFSGGSTDGAAGFGPATNESSNGVTYGAGGAGGASSVAGDGGKGGGGSQASGGGGGGGASQGGKGGDGGAGANGRVIVITYF